MSADRMDRMGHSFGPARAAFMVMNPHVLMDYEYTKSLALFKWSVEVKTCPRAVSKGPVDLGSPGALEPWVGPLVVSQRGASLLLYGCSVTLMEMGARNTLQR